MTGYMCGILPRIQAPGLKKLVIAPQLDPLNRVKSAQAYYDSAYGRITSGWKITETGAEFRVTLPAGVQATLHYQGTDFPLTTGENKLSWPE